MREAQGDAPVIYLIALVSRANGGEATTPRELRQVMRTLRRYVSGKAEWDKEAMAVDNAYLPRITRADIKAGHHYFLCKRRAGVRRPVAARRGEVRRFCDALERRLNSLPKEAEDKPLDKPLQYIGYAFNYAKRMKQHMHGESSYFMHLVNNVCQVLFPGKFNLESCPICFLAEEDEVRSAELLLAMLADSFSGTGGGFNVHSPGLNNSSADMADVPLVVAKRFWQERRNFREDENACQASRLLDVQLRAGAEERSTQQHDCLGRSHEGEKHRELNRKDCLSCTESTRSGWRSRGVCRG